MHCQYCKEENSENWFYCRSCGERASESMYTTNLYMMSEVGKRTDIEFSTTTMDSHIDKINKDRAKKNSKFWDGKLKDHRSRYAKS